MERLRILGILHSRAADPGVVREQALAGGHDFVCWNVRQQGLPDLGAYDAVVMFGGQMNVGDYDTCPWLYAEEDLIAAVIEGEKPYLGICLGAQMLAHVAGGAVERMPVSEVGWYELTLDRAVEQDPVLAALNGTACTFEWHGHRFIAPAEATVYGRSALCQQAFRLGAAAWGVQFHPEVTHTTIAYWLDDSWERDVAQRSGAGRDRVESETAERLAGWNALGRSLANRFFAYAASRKH